VEEGLELGLGLGTVKILLTNFTSVVHMHLYAEGYQKKDL